MDLRVIGLVDSGILHGEHVDSYVAEVNSYLQKQMIDVSERNMSLTVETLAVNDTVDALDDLLLRIENTSNILAIFSDLGDGSSLKDKLSDHLSKEGIPLLEMYPDVQRITKYPTLVSVTMLVNDVTSTMVRLLTYLRWSYVQAVFQDTSYFSNVLEHVKTEAGHSNICILKSFVISHDVTTTKILDTIQFLEREYNTSGVLLLMDNVLTKRFIETVKKHGSSTLFHFITIGSLDDTSVSPPLGTLAISREWTHTKVPGYVRNGTLESTSLKKTIQVLLHGVDAAMSDISRCLTGNTSVIPMNCIRMSLLDVLREDMGNISVYSYQGNISTMAWIKTMTAANDELKVISHIIFYDKDTTPFDNHVVSTSQPYRWECRRKNRVDGLHVSGHADVYLLAVFPMHERANTPNGCGDLDPDQVVLAEAAVYGIDVINNDMAILPGLSLGYVMIDSCSLPARTIFQLEQVYSGNAWNGINFHAMSQIFGAVGFTRHDEYTPLAGYLHSKDLLTISATAIDSDLSNKEVYPDFMRMVPDQREEISVMFQVLKAFGVEHIGIVYTEVLLNDASSVVVMDTAASFDISVVYGMRITEDISQIDSSMDYLVDEFIARNLNSTRVLVTFAEAEVLLPLFRAMERRNVENVMWIGDNSWFMTLHDDDLLSYSNLLQQAFVVGIPTYPVPSFNEHLTRMQKNNFTSDTYTDELFKLIDKCSNYTKDEVTYNICDRIHSDIFSHNDAYLVIDSVEALARSLDEVIHQTCPLGDFCQDARNNLANRLQENIFQNEFLGSIGKNIRFDSKGNGPASFGIYQVIFDQELKINKYQKVGSFEDGSLSVTRDLSISPIMKISDCDSNPCAHVPPEIFGRPYIYMDGDPMLYGFVKLYKYKGDDCSDEVNSNGYQAMKTMIWGVTAINNSTALLPNVTLGLAVFPTCGIPTKTKNIVQSALKPNLVLSSRGLPPNATILGIVGGENIGDAISMETATRTIDEDIPVIISSRADIDDNREHPRLFMTMPSPFEEMDYIVELCLQLKWTYIHVISDPFMDSVLKYFADLSEVNGICIASRNVLDISASTEITRSTLINMTEIEGATAVILLASSNTIKRVLTVSRELNLSGRLFFVLPFEIYNLEHHLSENDIGVLSTRQDIQINEQFMNYFLGLNIKDKANDPWFADFWQQANGCNLHFSTTYDVDCSYSESLLTSNVHASPSTNGILDSVFALGHALHGLLEDCKTNIQDCTKENRTKFYNNINRHLIAVNFTSPGGTPFKFRDKTTVFKALIVTNVQKSPEGGIRLVDVGTFVNKKLTLDMRKLSFYRNGVRVKPDSICQGDCRDCMDPYFVNEYDARVTSLRSAGPILQHKIFTALGVIDIILVLISFMFIGIATNILCKFYTHKVFSLCADADTGILLGCVLMSCSSFSYLFTQTYLMCTIQLGAPALSYVICIASFIVKINKTVCLRSYLGLHKSKVPRWDFAMTYIPFLLVPTIIAFNNWLQNEVVKINSTVPGIREILNIDDVTITWSCSFDRGLYSVYMTTFWFVTIEVFIVTLSYKLRSKKEPEVKQVMWSSTISLLFIAGSTVVLMLTGDVEIYGILMCCILNFSSMVFVCANFLPVVLILMTEEQQEHDFLNLMTKDRVNRMVQFWRDRKSVKVEITDDCKKGYAKSLWNHGLEISRNRSTAMAEEEV
ncbi:uncharacterized protein LOC132554312 [Ylistrum balloti]|uniref:uncharacterized protein LOC132554312 n=1 Tax=Ylistrum balloti TaxID=509963 RepID=UPI002905D8FB|nr:uncharacterized protein LOC132554312 [Ylistrum balloti]